MKPPDLLQFHVEKHSRNIILECCTICQISLSESGEPLSTLLHKVSLECSFYTKAHFSPVVLISILIY